MKYHCKHYKYDYDPLTLDDFYYCSRTKSRDVICEKTRDVFKIVTCGGLLKNCPNKHWYKNATPERVVGNGTYQKSRTIGCSGIDNWKPI